MGKSISTTRDPTSVGRPRFLSVQQAAQFLGVSPRTLYTWVEEMRIPFRKAGRRVLFLESELVEWTAPNLPKLPWRHFP